MLELPRRGFDLHAVQRRTRELMDEGADITRLNRERTAMSRLKGGGLARAIAPARIVNLVISDVPGHGPELVASGPTVLPGAITRVVADNRTACEAAARAIGVECSSDLLCGPAREAGRRLVAGPCGGPRVVGGETTVEVLGPGRGGRCQELVLGAAEGLRSGLLLAVGTDGIDGRSEAAGALLDEAVLLRASELGLDPRAFLARSDSARFFEQAGGALISGPTGTNVADLCLYLP